jgi:hypothetical protein
MSFTVSLSSASTSVVTLNYATANGTALALSDRRSDYVPISGLLTFASGETSKTISVGLLNDRVLEGDEFFWVNLSSASGASLSDAQAIGTIFDDESGGSSIPDQNHYSKRRDGWAQELASWWMEFDREWEASVTSGRRARR